jgi:hypothetical protein
MSVPASVSAVQTPRNSLYQRAGARQTLLVEPMRSYVICCVQRTGSWLLAHTLAVAAVVAGMRGYTAIAGWVKDVPPPVLADLYLRAGAGPARPPSKATIWRVITDAGADMLDAAAGSWLMSSLLSEPAGQGEVAAQARTRMI